jgi:hypothetical protein
MPRFSVGSSFERGRVLQELVSRRDASPETVLAAMRSAGSMDGVSSANVLLAAAKSHRLEEPARDAYTPSPRSWARTSRARSSQPS